MTLDQPTPAPGWYPNQQGHMQWWDGNAWGAYAGPPVIIRKAKDTGIAYLFAILLGGVAAHKFYLNQIAEAIIFNVLWWGGWLLTGFGIGFFMLGAAVIWWIIDLFLIPSYVRAANTQ